MNENALYTHISRTLHTFVRIYDMYLSQLNSFCDIPNLTDPLLINEEIQSFLLSPYGRKNEDRINAAPILRSINQKLYYALFYNKENKQFILVGPVRLEAIIPISENISHITSHKVWDDTVSLLSPTLYLDTLCLLFNLFNKDLSIEPQDILEYNSTGETSVEGAMKIASATRFENNETQTTHNPYDQELREQTAIEHGDIEQFQKSIKEDYTGKIGTLAKDELRQIKDVGIVVITLASRSAIRGGLSPEVSFTLSDGYIQKIEELTHVPAVMPLVRAAELQYTQLVHDLKQKDEFQKQKNLRVDKCKDYIFSHLHDPITVDILAEEVGCNPNYLSQLFKKCEGISISQYILNEKINRTKNLLVYSEYSYIEIATYLGFASQSHLGQQFKRMTGYTLRGYRQTFGRRE